MRGLLPDDKDAVAALTKELQLKFIHVNATRAASHVPVLERKIGVTMATMRGHTNSLPFALFLSPHLQIKQNIERGKDNCENRR